MLGFFNHAPETVTKRCAACGKEIVLSRTLVNAAQRPGRVVAWTCGKPCKLELARRRRREEAARGHAERSC
jgi:hypothetical protein